MRRTFATCSQDTLIALAAHAVDRGCPRLCRRLGGGSPQRRESGFHRPL